MCATDACHITVHVTVLGSHFQFARDFTHQVSQSASSPWLSQHLIHDASTIIREDNVIRPLSVTVAFVGALPQHLVDTKGVS